MKRSYEGVKILIWTFAIFFTLAWIGLKVEQKYFPRDPNVYCTV